jgi:hypothetical protein
MGLRWHGFMEASWRFSFKDFPSKLAASKVRRKTIFELDAEQYDSQLYRI